MVQRLAQVVDVLLTIRLPGEQRDVRLCRVPGRLTEQCPECGLLARRREPDQIGEPYEIAPAHTQVEAFARYVLGSGAVCPCVGERGLLRLRCAIDTGADPERRQHHLDVAQQGPATAAEPCVAGRLAPALDSRDAPIG